MRVFVAVLAALAVCACNWVVTKTPLFGRADAAGAAQPRAGVWSAAPSADCKFDEKKPITEWPDCAGRLVILPGHWMTLDQKNDHRRWSGQAVVLTGGAPQILQTPPQGKDAEGGYAYYGLAAKARDARGRITAFELWPVLCGPPAPKSADGQTQAAVHPFPGMTMDAKDSDCTTTSKAALHEAADASRLWADAPMTAHWVRDGLR